MKTVIVSILITLSFLGIRVFSQSVQYPVNINLANLDGLESNVAKVNTFPLYIDNQHPMPPIKNKKLWSGELAGISLLDNVPKVSVDDFRYGYKFVNPYGDNGIGYLSLMYWLPSSGSYLLFLYILENGMDDYRRFLVTTNLSGEYIDHLLVNDGWNDDPYSVNFTQAVIHSNLNIDLYEIRNLNPSYVSISDLTSFTGQKATYSYSINTTGHFVLHSTVLGTQRNYVVSELKGLINNLN